MNSYVSYSEVRALLPQINYDITIFPNPSFNGLVNVLLESEEPVEILIRDSQGLIIQKCAGRLGLNNFELGRLAGVYVISVVKEMNVEHYKVIVE